MAKPPDTEDVSLGPFDELLAVKHAPDDGDSDWSDFSLQVELRMSQCRDECTVPADIASALIEERDEVVASRQYTGFASAVLAKAHAPVVVDAIVAATLRAERDAAISAGEFATFADGVLATVAIGAALTAESAAVTGAIDSMFTDAVMGRVREAPAPVAALESGSAELPASIRAGLLAERDAAVPNLEATFADAVMSKVGGAAELPASIRAGLLAERDAVVPNLEATFADAVMSKVGGAAELPASVRAALVAESADVVAARDYANFADAVIQHARVDAPIPAEVRAALITARDEAIAARDFHGVADAAIARAVEATEASAPEVAALLRAEATAAADARDWGMFSASVDETIRADRRATARAPLDEQAISHLRAEVEAELDAVAPRFEKKFAKDVDKGIAADRPGLFDGIVEWFRDLTTPARWAIGGLATAGAALLVLFATATPPPSIPDGPQMAQIGEVSVDDVSFEGTITVMSDDGIAVIWLSDAS